MTAKAELPGKGDRLFNVLQNPNDPHFVLADILASQKMVALEPAFSWDGASLSNHASVVIIEPEAKGVIREILSDADFVTLYFAQHGRNISPERMSERLEKSEIFDKETKENLLKRYFETREKMSANNSISPEQMKEYVLAVMKKVMDGPLEEHPMR